MTCIKLYFLSNSTLAKCCCRYFRLFSSQKRIPTMKLSEFSSKNNEGISPRKTMKLDRFCILDSAAGYLEIMSKHCAWISGNTNKYLRLSASCRPNWGPPETTQTITEHHIVLRVLRDTLNWAHINPRNASFSDRQCEFFFSLGLGD